MIIILFLFKIENNLFNLMLTINIFIKLFKR